MHNIDFCFMPAWLWWRQICTVLDTLVLGIGGKTGSGKKSKLFFNKPLCKQMDMWVCLCRHKSNTTQQSHPPGPVHRCERQNKLDQTCSGKSAVISQEMQFIRPILLMKQRKMRRDNRLSYTILILAEMLSDTMCEALQKPSLPRGRAVVRQYPLVSDTLITWTASV